MTTDSNAPLPRWAGITEPTTVLTNVVLAGFAFVLGARVGYMSAAEGSAAGSFIALGLLATAVAASFGAAAHGLDPRTDREQREQCWRLALYATGFVGAASIASVAFFTARGLLRTAILVVAGLKLLVYLVRVTRRRDFRVAAVDYGGALAVLFVGSLYAMVRWGLPGTSWMMGGVGVSLVAGLVQARRIAPHRWFNHNDLYHVVQMVALYLFYRGGALLVDR
jgi:hypothetical protein